MFLDSVINHINANINEVVALGDKLSKSEVNDLLTFLESLKKDNQQQDESHKGYQIFSLIQQSFVEELSTSFPSSSQIFRGKSISPYRSLSSSITIG